MAFDVGFFAAFLVAFDFGGTFFAVGLEGVVQRMLQCLEILKNIVLKKLEEGLVKCGLIVQVI